VLDLSEEKKRIEKQKTIKEIEANNRSFEALAWK